MNEEKSRLIRSFIFPLAFLSILWVIRTIESLFHLEFGHLGILPLDPNGLVGIVAAPLIHADWGHLLANTFPLLFLSAGLFFFYHEIAYKIFFLIYFMTGLWVWVFARDNYHIGASGLIYGQAAFLFLSGIIRKEPRVLALSMLVVFLYGSMVWGIFPDFFPEQNISWQSHMMGMIAGFILAVYYRKEGPQRQEHIWDDEEDEMMNNNDDVSKNDQIRITYHLKEKKKDQ